ncbi:MAG: NAD(P)-dependent oxidoreductase [Planctomycetales bacterium]|nr:NAD(P)-dependent oxidoreductase [Planctomycetales bacterium]
MRAFVTGITGFAGSFLAEHLLSERDAALGCSLHGRWDALTPSHVPQQVDLFGWDIAAPAPAAVVDRVRRFAPQVIYHLAGISLPQRCGTQEPTPEAISVNVEGTRHVLDLAAQIDPHPRVLFVSSRYVYGGPTSSESPPADAHRVSPQSAYGKTKLAGEQAALAMLDSHHVESVIARAFNHTGPRQWPPLLLPQWCQQLIQGQRPLEVYNPNVWLDLCDVRDVVRAYRLLAMHGRPGAAYDVGSGSACRCGDLLAQLTALAAPDWPLAAKTNEEQHLALADTGAIFAETGWQAEIPLAQTLRDTWQFWVEQKKAFG